MTHLYWSVCYSQLSSFCPDIGQYLCVISMKTGKLYLLILVYSVRYEYDFKYSATVIQIIYMKYLFSADFSV